VLLTMIHCGQPMPCAPTWAGYRVATSLKGWPASRISRDRSNSAESPGSGIRTRFANGFGVTGLVESLSHILGRLVIVNQQTLEVLVADSSG
jgi:hypothetical protein